MFIRNAAVVFAAVLGLAACAPRDAAPPQEEAAAPQTPAFTVDANGQIDDTWRGQRAIKSVFQAPVTMYGVTLQYETWGDSPASETVHVSEQITDQMIVGFQGPGETGTVGEPQPALVKDLFAIKGVASVHLYPYRISIEKGHTFSWEELNPQISMAVLKNLKK